MLSCVFLLACLVSLSSSHRVREAGNAIGELTDNNKIGKLTVRVDLAELPKGQRNKNASLTAKLGNREFTSEYNVVANALVFQMPLLPRDGSLKLTLSAGRRKMGSVQKLLRKYILSKPSQWLKFDEALQGGSGRISFQVYYDNELQKEKDEAGKGVEVKKKKAKGDISLQDVALYLHKKAGDALESPLCREDNHDFRIYFAVMPTGIEACFFKGSNIEVQVCRGLKGHGNLKNEIMRGSAFEYKLDRGVAAFGTSSISGELRRTGVKRNRVVFRDSSGDGRTSEYVYTNNCDRVSTITTTLFSYGDEAVH